MPFDGSTWVGEKPSRKPEGDMTLVEEFFHTVGVLVPFAVSGWALSFMAIPLIKHFGILGASPCLACF